MVLTVGMNKKKSNQGVLKMKHWKTKEEMGEGYQFNQDEHNENEYNSLVVIDEHETNTMRTKYLIRDIWDIEQLHSLKEFLEEEILNREADADGLDLDIKL